MRFVILSLASAFLCTTSDASPLLAQGVPPADTAPVATLPAIVVTAEPADGNWFVRAAGRRQAVVDLKGENRRLRRVLHAQDAQVARLETRLDSLKRLDAARRAALATLHDSIAATQARRAALEARLRALESQTAPPPR